MARQFKKNEERSTHIQKVERIINEQTEAWKGVKVRILPGHPMAGYIGTVLICGRSPAGMLGYLIESKFAGNFWVTDPNKMIEIVERK